jgi:UDPglucose 6-dehydrogenase|tara:strand:+ start:4781 stop:5629 length:849 start_codon:yes stop_codon:yes gene_type:complete
MKIGIIGNGFVGKATNILENDNVELVIYDIDPKLCSPIGTTIENICETDIVFISVPTPMNSDGSCHIGILESVVSDIKKVCDLNENLIVIRSTVPPGTSNNLNCYFMPEFLTEKNFVNDFINNENWIFGLKNTEQDILFKNKITELFNYSYEAKKINYNNLHFVTNNEAEMIKLFRNNYLSVKVGFCNEIAEFCEKKNIDYENVRELATLDNRIGSSHTKVPGHDGRKGYGGTCFPKDTNNLKCEMKKVGMKSYIIDNVVERNEKVDRPEQDWNSNKGRAVI